MLRILKSNHLSWALWERSTSWSQWSRSKAKSIREKLGMSWLDEWLKFKRNDGEFPRIPDWILFFWYPQSICREENFDEEMQKMSKVWGNCCKKKIYCLLKCRTCLQMAVRVCTQEVPTLVKRRKTHFHNLPCGVSVITRSNKWKKVESIWTVTMQVW